MTNPKLSIIIITLNEEKRLPLLLSDLADQSWRDFEIVHVDSKSDDRTVDVSKAMQNRFSDYRIDIMETRGVSLGRNLGAVHARSQRLLFLDADTRLAPDFLRRAMVELDRRSLDVGVVCMSADGLSWPYRAGFALFNAGIRASSRVFPTGIGACLFSTRELHETIGGFDESIQLCEDCNYVLKAHREKRPKLGVLEAKFRFDPRRLEQDGFLKTGLTYLFGNLRRLFIGEMRNHEIAYKFGHYK